MLPLLALLFIAVPILEITLILKVGQELGFNVTLAIIVTTAVIGAVLARRQGSAIIGQLKSALRGQGQLGTTLVEGFLILCAGIMLLTPGFVTDLLGIACLIPPIRQVVARKFVESGRLRNISPLRGGSAQGHSPRSEESARHDVIDV